MQDIRGLWALITGASSGFGVDFAHLLAARGANLVLVARRTAPMEELAAQLRAQHGVQVRVTGLDLTAADAATQLKQGLDADGIAIDILINNAGYGLYGEFLQQPLEKTLDMMQLNMLSLTRLTHVFVQQMKQRGRGYMLLIASIAAYQATPTYAAYAGSKGYVLLFGEALHQELAPYGVKVSVLSPGITATNFLAVSGQRPTLYQRLVMMQSRPVAHIGLQAMFKGKLSVVPGLMNKLTIFSNRFTPRSIQSKVAYTLMKN